MAASAAAGSKTAPATRGVLGQWNAALSVRHIATVIPAKMTAAGLPANATVLEIEATVIRGQGENIICPRDGRLGAAYVDSVGEHPDDVGLANFMLSYSWGYTVEDIGDTLLQFCRSHEAKPEETYVWLCCVCINQHRVKEAQKAGNIIPFEEFCHEFKQRVEGIGHIIAMMVPWRNPGYIKRIWCDFELYTATNRGLQVTVLMPPREIKDFLQSLRGTDGLKEVWDVLRKVDVEKAEASVEVDRNNILTLIKSGPGFRRFNNSIAKFLQLWIMTQSESYLLEQVAKGEYGKELVQLCMAVGELFMKMGEAQKALVANNHAVEIVESGRCPISSSLQSQWLDIVLRNRSVARRILGDLDGAEADLRRAKELGIEDEVSDRLANANMLVERGDLEGALKLATDALALCDPAQEGYQATIYQTIANANTILGNLEAGQEAYQRAQELMERQGSLETPAGALLMQNWGNLRSKQNDFQGAVQAYEKAREIYEATGTQEGQYAAECSLNLAIAHWNAHDAEGARAAAEQAVPIFDRLGHKADAARAKQLIDLADVITSEMRS